MSELKEPFDLRVKTRSYALKQLHSHLVLSSLPRFVASTAELTVEENWILKELVARLSAFCLAGDTVTTSRDEWGESPISFYATWWQFFKRTYMPGFFIRWFPIKNETYTVHHITKHISEHVTKVCPHADVVWDRHGAHRHMDFMDAKPRY